MAAPQCFFCKSKRVIELSRETRVLPVCGDAVCEEKKEFTICKYFCLDCGYTFEKVPDEEMGPLREHYGNWNMHIDGYQ